MRSRIRNFGALLGIVVLGTVGLVALAPAAVADTLGPVDSSIPDGQANSLRDVLENQVGDGDVVELQAGATYRLTDCESGSLNIDSSITVHGNGATVEQTCDELVMDVDADLTIDGLTITGGNDVGGRPAGGIHFDGSELVITNSSIVGNSTCSDGGGILMDGGDSLRIENSTIAGNSAGGDGGAIASWSGTESSLDIVNSTITDNVAAFGGGIAMFDGGPVSLTYTTLVGNTTGVPQGECVGSDSATVDDAHAADHSGVHAQADSDVGANVEFFDQSSVLTSFGTVIALPTGGPNCSVEVEVVPAEVLSNTESHGYNFSDDASCGLAGTGDRQSAGDPMLAALSANGGPTLTRLPATSSPLVDGVPLAQCRADGAAGITADQRGITRPQGAGCDIGAVELVIAAPTPPEAAPLVVTPRFTG
jgi:hypothetical protein